MRKQRNFMKNLVKPLLWGAVASSALAGCQTSDITSKLPNFSSKPVPGPAMKPAPLPTFLPGDKYYYTNGARDQVVTVNGDVVNVLSRSNRKTANFRNFILPSPYAEGKTKEYFKDSSAPTDVMWPLAVGQSARFSTQGRSVTKATGYETGYRQKWSCKVTGTARTRVIAGEFDTYVVECTRRSATSNKWWQTRTWYYAPILGTYVLRSDRYKGKAERFRELTAVRPALTNDPKHVRSGIIKTWQTALEVKQSGEIASWTDPKTRTSVQVEPLNTYKAQNGQFCRSYKQYLTRQGNTRIYMGVACRTGKMKWRTPRRG